MVAYKCMNKIKSLKSKELWEWEGRVMKEIRWEARVRLHKINITHLMQTVHEFDF